MKYWKTYLFLLLVAIVTGAWFFKPSPPLAVRTAPAIQKTICEYIEEEGKVQLQNEIKIFPSLAGYLGPITVDVGDHVQKDQILAVIDTLQQQKELDVLQSSITGLEARIQGLDQVKPKKDEYAKVKLLIEQAQNQYNISQRDFNIISTQFTQTKRDYERIRLLHEQKIATQQDLDSITTKYQIEQESITKCQLQQKVMQQNLDIEQTSLQLLQDAEDDQEYLRQVYASEIQANRARILILENDLKKTTLTSPFDGIILERVTKGNVHLSFVTPDYYILKIGDLRSAEIKVDILSDDIPKIKIGQRALVFGPAVGHQKLSAKVRKIFPSAFTKLSSLGIEQQRVTVLLDVDNQYIHLLHPGYRVDVRIFTREVSDTIVIQSQAVFILAGKKSCFVVENNQAKLQSLQVGIETEEETEIQSGLQKGQAVILDPPSDLSNGSRVIEQSGQSTP